MGINIKKSHENSLGKIPDILIVSRSARRWPSIGGAPKGSMLYASALLRLEPQKYKVHFIGQYKPSNEGGNLSFIQVKPFLDINSGKGLMYYIKTLLLDIQLSFVAVKYIYKHKEIKLVHLNANIASIIVKLFTRVKIIYTIHDSIYSNKEVYTTKSLKLIKLLNNLFLERIAIMSCNYVIAVSLPISNVVSRLTKKPVTVIYFNTLLQENNRVPIEDKLAINSHTNSFEIRIISVGEQDRRKRFDILLEAFNLLRIHNKKLLLVGTGSEHPNLVRLAQQMSLGSMVVFLTDINDTELHLEYQNATCFALVSESEGFPIAVIEAMQFGCPVLLSLKTGSSELKPISNELFRICNSLNPIEVAIELEGLIDRIGKDKDIKQRVKQYASETFKLDSFALKLQEAYDTALKM